MKKQFKKQQAGFAILTMILLAVALIAVIGGVIAASRSNASSTSDQSTKLLASSVIDEANNISTGVSIMLSKGTSMTQITDSSTDDGTASLFGVYNPTVGGSTTQTPATGSTTNTTTKWVMKIDSTKSTDATRPVLTASGVGTAAADYTVALANISLGVCQQINVITHGLLASATPDAVTTGATADFTTAANAIVTDPVKHAGWNNGCVKTTDGQYAYFEVVKPQ
jgi:Flp pilus assembly protein TadG